MRLHRPLHTNKMYQLPDEQMGLYNYIDVAATGDSWPALQQEAAERDMLTFFQERVWPLVEPVMDMQRRGICVDLAAQRALRHQVARELADTDQQVVDADTTGTLKEATDNYPNSLNSTPKVSKFLYDQLGLRCHKATKGGGRSVDQEALLACLTHLRKMDEPHQEVIYNLLHRSKLQTILERYVGVVPEADGRTRPRIKMGGTETGRFAYDEPPVQQYPLVARRIFVPAPGHVFCGGDYQQLEARIAAYLANDILSMRVFEEGGDIHAENARSLFKWDLAQWDDLDPKVKSAARDDAKRFLYRLLYGGDPEDTKVKTYCPCPRCVAKLPKSMNLPKVGVVEANQRWMATHPGYLTYRSEVDHQVSRNHYLVNALGRKRYFMEPWPRCKRSAWNWPIQSLAAEIMNEAMVDGWRRYRVPWWLQHHDYSGLECRTEEVPVWQDRLATVMEREVALGGRLVTFPVDLKVEAPWGSKVSLLPALSL